MSGNKRAAEAQSAIPAGSYSKFNDSIGRTISFRPVVLDSDMDLLLAWHHEPHVQPFWQLAVSRERYRAHLQAFLADTHQALYIGMLDGVPMSYWERYWAVDDVLASYYESLLPTDQGIHLLIGPPEFVGKGYALPLLRAMVSFMLEHEATSRIVAEPDARNAKMIHIFEKCGFERQGRIQLPDKMAELMICLREPFVRRWEYGHAY